MNLTLGIFIVILLITLGITYWAARRTHTTSDFYAADSQLTASQNGFALAGDWCSAAAFLGFTGLTALYGMDGAFYALGPLVAFCTVLFLIAEPMRNTGKYTLGDIIRSRMMTRFYTVPDAKPARRSVVWVMFLAGAFFAGTTLFGLAAANFVGQDAIRAADKGGNLTLPLLAQYLGGGKGTFGGDLMLGFVAAVAVATILAVVSALTLSTSGAIAHDFYVNWVKRGQVDGKQEVWIARIAAVVIGVLAIALGILAQGVNLAVLEILGFWAASSLNFPVPILSLFWRRFNTGGVGGGMTAGLISSVFPAGSG